MKLLFTRFLNLIKNLIQPIAVFVLFAITCNQSLAQDYYENLRKELADSFNLPSGEFYFGNTYEEAMSKFYMEGYEYNPPADGLSIVNVADMPFNKALRAVNSSTKSYDWSNNFKAKMDKPIKNGDVLLLVLYVRGVESRDERGYVFARTLVGDYNSYHTYSDATGPKWKKHYFGVIANADAEANAKVLQFFVGEQRQTMDIGGLALINYGTSVTLDQLPKTKIDYNYEGRNPAATWRAEADSRIDAIRKSNLKVIVKDSSGNLIPGAQVEVRMKRHAFKFGTLVHNYDILNNQKYREVFAENFTWADVNSKYDIYSDATTLKNTDDVVNWIRGQGIPVRMNTLVYPQFIQTEGIDPTTLYNTHANYVRNVVTHFKGRIESHNVLNEAPYYPGLDNALQPLFPGYGRPSAEWFKIAKEADPNALMEENNAGRLGNLPGAIRTRQLDSALLAWGAPLDVVGEEGHQGATGLSIPQLLSDLDLDYSTFNKPIRITEFDIPADPTNAEEVSAAADFTRDYYTALFSHPGVDGINAWGFWEPNMWNTGSNGVDNRRHKAWWTNDWQITPVGQAYRDVVFGKYWTNEKVTANEQGEAIVRAFKGTHEIIATQGLVQNRMVVKFLNDTTVIIQLFPDKEAPSQPKNLVASHTATTATLSWEASTDNVHVIGYDVFQGDTKINETAIANTTFTVRELNQATTYSFTVVARDTAGNVSIASNPVTLTTDSIKLYLNSVCSANPLSTRRWEVKSTFDTVAIFRWSVRGTLQAGVDTVQANDYAYFETANTGASNVAEISWQDPDGSIKSATREASWNYCPTTVRLDNDNYGKTQIYNYKEISNFLAAFRVHQTFNKFEDIHYYTSPDGVTYTKIAVDRQGVPEDVGGGWTLAKFSPQSIPSGTNYLKIEVVGGTMDWATYLDWIEVSYDPTPETISCPTCIEVVDKLDDWTKSYSHTNWYFVNPAPGSANEAGDLSLAVRGSTGSENIIYNCKEIKDFSAALIYHATFPVSVKVFTSADNSSYTEVALDSAISETAGGWYKRVYSIKDSLPTGINFVKLEVSGGTQNWTPEVSQVNILYQGNACTDCITASDSLNNWNKTYSHSNNWYFAQDAEANVNFNYDESRAVRGDTGTEQVIYRFNKIEDFNADFIYHTTFPAAVKFYTSPDNYTYTEIPVANSSQETGGGWYLFRYIPVAKVPSGTNFLKIEVSGGEAAWTPQLSQVNILYHKGDVRLPVVQSLTLTSVCSDQPGKTRRWRITNPNHAGIHVNWSVYSSTQKGVLVAGPGETYFSTITEQGPNTTIIQWANEKGELQTQTKAAGKDQCKSTARENFEMAYEDMKLEVSPNPASTHFTVSLYSTEQQEAKVLIHNSLGGKVHDLRSQLKTGINKIYVSTEGMTSGLYVIKVISKSRQQMKKILINNN